jgi:polyisoprenoid-binding protein YceI
VHRVEGTLTLRGVEHAVTTELTVWSYEPTALRATGRLAFDRRRWGMDFSGSPLTDDLVDDTVHLEFDIVARQEGR